MVLSVRDCGWLMEDWKTTHATAMQREMAA